MHELKSAKAAQVTIITVVNNDKFHNNDIIQQYNKLGLQFLFSEQVLICST